MQVPGRIMFFDVETTGLMKKNSDSNQPYIIQLCFIIYDSFAQVELRTYNKYIHINPDVEITPFIQELTGITRDKCDSGVPIEEALAEFIHEYLLCETIVAHNIRFDRDMIRIELSRKDIELRERGYADISRIFNEVHESINKKKIFCTMAAGTDICALWIVPKTARKPYKKFPKLSELHSTLFGEVPDGMHDALMDTAACMRCYIKLESHNQHPLTVAEMQV